MQPGDLYQSPDRRDPYAPHPQQQQQYQNQSSSRPFPTSQTYPQQGPPAPPYNLNAYDTPPPAAIPPPSQPFPSSASFGHGNGSGNGYADPFGDPAQNGSGVGAGAGAGGWANQPGSRHYASYPNLNVTSPPPQSQPPLHTHSPRQSLPTGQPAMSMSPPHTHQQASIPLQPPRTRFDSNVSYQSSNSLAPSQSYGYNPDDGRLSSPPPLLPHHSSSSSSFDGGAGGLGGGYPPRQTLSHSQSGYLGTNNNDDDMDSAPLLNHASVDPRFGIPQSHSAMSIRPELTGQGYAYDNHNRGNSPAPGAGPARYQLNDNGYGPGGDVGVIPNRWKGSGAGSLPGGYPDGGASGVMPEYGLGGMTPPEQEENNVHYGPVPTKVLRRNRTQKKVNLFHGHLVLDIEVPSMLLDKVPYRDENEFTKMRYTAVTCDPNDFVDDQYTLRQRLYDPPRQTELFIVVTMYNEDDVLFCRTMRGIFQNIAHLCTRTKSKTWGKEGWKKVVVCVVADGRLKINPRTRSVLAALGVYQDGVGTNVVNGKPVTAHVYEYTTQLWIDSDNKLQPPNPSKHVPVQMIFCLKEKNQKKINSHRWFFNAFGACLRPNVCVLLDVGTQPGSDSIYHLWKAFDINSSVGGACGEIVALKGLFWRNLLNPLVAAQNFEYKMSNILDKPLESIFGYITVLPGAFSAYRYIALQNDDKGNGPLKQYFLGETMHGSGAGIFAANMYLAEDRILCWELVSKRECKWTLHYVKSAYAITDVPDAVPELVSQRRRWLNGSFFAAIHSIVHFGYLYRSSHSVTRKVFLHVECFYQLVNLVFSWFALGNFYIAFVVLTNSLDSLGTAWKYINIPLQYMYIALLLLCFLLSLGNRPAGSKWGYTISMIGFAILTVYMIFAAVFLAVKGIENVTQNGVTVGTVFGNKIFRNIVLSLLATYGLYIVASLLALEPWHMVTSFVQYLLLAPSYINVMNVYAFSNVHDVSWGTKGSDKVSEDLGVVKSGDNKNEVMVMIPTEQKDLNAVYENEMRIINSKAPKEEVKVAADQKQEDYYKNFRTNVLLAWTMSNAGLVAVILQTNSSDNTVATTYMGVMLYTVAGLALFRFLGSTVYLVVRLFAGE